MYKNISKKFLLIMFISFAIITGCGKKDDPKDVNSKGDNKSGSPNADLVVKDDKGTKITLDLKPKKNDVFKYKMNALTTSKEISPMSGDKELVSTQDINYYYSEEVNDVSSAGIITYKIKFDSINILSTVTSGDSSVKVYYNSNVKDSIYGKPDFIQYNSIMNEEFFARVTPKGEISEIYGLEKVYENMFKSLGDTLDAAQKESLKSSFGKEAIQAVLQQQFQIFPDNPVYKDSTWSRSYDTQIMIFPVRNILSYKLNDIKEENNQYTIKIDADLAVDFMKKEIKDEKMTYKIEDAKTGGKGTVEFNLSKGCVTGKQTSTNIDIGMKLSAGGQSVKTSQNVTTALSIQLLK
ncbi:MAG TPA: DUF6263 family protein [Ignavibacteria bacterium]|nr:DUF6263 family protein [Ignavibacteria bacterium]